MFCRSVSWLLCIFLVAATADDYSAIVSSSPPGIYPKDTDYLLENNDVGIDPEVTDNQLENDNVAGVTPAAPGADNPRSQTPTPGVASGRGGSRGGGSRRGPWPLRRTAAGESSTTDAGEAASVDLGALLDAGSDAMMTLVAGQRRIGAHRAVLSDRAARLHPAGGQLVKVIPDVEGPVLRRLVYSRRAPPPRQLSDALQLLEAAGSGRRQCSLRRPTTPPDPAVCPTASPLDLSNSSLRSFPAEKKGALLIEAAKWGAIEELRALLAAGAEVGTMDKKEYGRTAQHWAAWNGDSEAVRALLDAGADVNARSSLLRTPLQLAAQSGRAEVVRLLLAECADPNTANTWGWTPLHEAASHGHPEVAEALLQAGADAGARTDSDGETPLDIARNARTFKVAKVLLRSLGCEYQASQLLTAAT